jgi:hypothetical protein
MLPLESINDSNIDDGGYYRQYKDATRRFYNWMANDACPASNMKTVNDYRRGVDRIVEHNLKVQNEREFIVAPPAIMKSLAACIRLREKVTAQLFASKSGGDPGHQYIIDVLKYCRTSLRFANRVAAVRTSSEGGGAQDAIGGRFQALTVDDDDEEEIDWVQIDRDIKNGNAPKFVGVEVEDEIDIKEALLRGDDRFQAMILLFTMCALMIKVHHSYAQLKAFMRGNAEDRRSSNCMQLLMKCAVVANAATECVSRTENELMLDHPHLSSFYHVLALVVLTDYIALINERIDTAKLEKDPHMALDFVAKVVQTSFHENKTVRLPPLLAPFVNKSGLDLQFVTKIARDINWVTAGETSFELERLACSDLTAKYDAAGMRPHMWLRAFQYIGGDCCILNTHRCVELSMDMVEEDNRKLAFRPGSWGKPFHENQSPARSITGDLDEPFMATILPELIETCKYWPVDCLPNRSFLITVLDQFQRHLKCNLGEPVPIAVTFGLHSVLMSIFVLQGDGDLTRIAASSKQSYNMLFKQLEAVSDRTKAPENCLDVYAILTATGKLAKFAKPVNEVVAAGDLHRAEDLLNAEMLAYWNPLIAGEYMLYATYMCSIGQGAKTVNSRGQLRSVLHLYNGLKLHDPTFNVLFLEKLDSIFIHTKAVWVGRKPGRGSLYKSFWMSCGMNASQVSNLVALGQAGSRRAAQDDSMNRSYEGR